MSVNEDLLDWARHLLGTETSVQPVVQTPWSCVLRLENAEGVFYLKQTPPSLWIEADILSFCEKVLRLDCTPRLRGADKALGCFLMQACGDMTLRTYFDGTLDIDILCRGVASYRRLTDAAAAHTEALLKVGVPDWRLQTLPAVFEALGQNTDFLRSEGFDATEVQKLRSAQKPLATACAALENAGIPDTLCHCDFHDNNITIDRRTGETAIIDLGETAVCHPFLPLNGLLRRLGGRYGLGEGGPQMKQLEVACFDGWSVAPQERDRALAYAAKLSPLFYALSYIRLSGVTPDLNEKAPRMRGRIHAGLSEIIAHFAPD